MFSQNDFSYSEIENQVSAMLNSFREHLTPRDMLLGKLRDYNLLVIYLDDRLFKLKNNLQLQPNIAVQYSDFEVLDDAMVVYDLGVNCYFKGHSNKLSLGYQNRPVFQDINNQLKVDERKGMFVLQYQIEIN